MAALALGKADERWKNWRWSRTLPNGGYSPARLAKRAACPHHAAKFPRSVGRRKKAMQETPCRTSR